MPLINKNVAGIDAFEAAKHRPDVADEDFAYLWKHKDAILSVYRQHPELLDRPYEVIWAKGFFIAKNEANESAVVQLLTSAGLGYKACRAEECFPEWDDVVYPGGKPWSAIAYAFVDLTLYMVFLLNQYVPDAAVLKNLYSLNLYKDALGREQQDRAIRAVDKRLGTPSYEVNGRLSRDILRMIRLDLSPGQAPAQRGIEFEKECRSLLEEAGFSVQVTATTGDFGADLIASKDGLRFAIQCKDLSKPVGVSAVQEVVAARRHYIADFAVVCVSGAFTDAAVELAASNKVLLCQGGQLVRRLEAL